MIDNAEGYARYCAVLKVEHPEITPTNYTQWVTLNKSMDRVMAREHSAH